MGLGRFSDAVQGVGFTTLVKKALARPGVALKALARIAGPDWRPMVAGTAEQWRVGRDEFRAMGILEDLQGRLRDSFAELHGQTVRGKPVTPGGMRSLHLEMLWTIVRRQRPARVVETGVCNGLSSAVILAAMDLNGCGELVSVDLPEFSEPSMNNVEFWVGKGGAVIPAGREVGWLVPQEHRKRWRLVLGRSRELLPQILREKPVDVFIHDSEHSYDNQVFEFEAGFKALRRGGLLVATDANWSDALVDVCMRGKWTRLAYVDHSCAIAVKV